MAHQSFQTPAGLFTKSLTDRCSPVEEKEQPKEKKDKTKEKKEKKPKEPPADPEQVNDLKVGKITSAAPQIKVLGILKVYFLCKVYFVTNLFCLIKANI